MKNIQKRICGILLILVMVLELSVAKVEASSVPYDTYNFDYWEYIIQTPAAYYPDGAITGVLIGTKNFNNPQDMCLDDKNRLYIADTGNNRIVVVNNDYKSLYTEIVSFLDDNGEEQRFNTPSGVFVSENGQLYICDTENKRVVVLELNEDTKTFEFVTYIMNPTSSVLDEGFEFKPKKVAVDYANRAYVISKNVFQGIMAFDSNGKFTGFFGTINVSLGFWDKFWRRLSTKEQRGKQTLYIPTEYTGIDIDADGFVYASYIDEKGTQAAMRLNPKGENVIHSLGNLGGDHVSGIANMGDYGGYSYIIDIAYRGKGIYSILDSRRGRIFTYDHEGNLLYIYGGIGTQEGTFTIPSAIEDNGTIMLGLDSYTAEVFLYSPTGYGSLINEAVQLRYDGDETQAVQKWQQVLKYDENFELANVGIGKAYLTSGDYKNAMKYLKLGKNRKYYSIAFRRYRNDILRDNLGYVLTGLAIFGLVFSVYKYIRKRRLGKEEDE